MCVSAVVFGKMGKAYAQKRLGMRDTLSVIWGQLALASPDERSAWSIVVYAPIDTVAIGGVCRVCGERKGTQANKSFDSERGRGKICVAEGEVNERRSHFCASGKHTIDFLSHRRHPLDCVPHFGHTFLATEMRCPHTYSHQRCLFISFGRDCEHVFAVRLYSAHCFRSNRIHGPLLCFFLLFSRSSFQM